MWTAQSKVSIVASISQHAKLPQIKAFADLNPLTVVLNSTMSFAFAESGEFNAENMLALELDRFSSQNSGKVPIAQPWLPGDISAGNVTAPAPVPDKQVAEVTNLQRRLKRGAAVYLHCWAVLLDDDGHPPHPISTRGHVLSASTPLVSKSPFKPPKRKMLLVQRDAQSLWGWRFRWSLPPPPSFWPAETQPAPQWLGAADVRLILDETRYPRDMRLVPELARMTLQNTAMWGKFKYVPTFSVNAIRPTQERRRWLLPQNSTQTALPLHLTVGVAGPAKLNLLSLMEHAITQQHSQWGTTDRDTDDLVRLLVETPAWLLALTFAVSILHLCMDILAFAQDVLYWRSMKSDTLARLSSRSVRVDFIFQAIVALYLSQRDTSWLVMLPAGGGVLIGAWKVVKTFGVKIDSAGKTQHELQHQQRQQKRVAAYDATAMSYVSWVLLPPLAGWAVFSLFFKGESSLFSACTSACCP